MKSPLNRRVYVVGYAASTSLGHGLRSTWDRACAGESGIGLLTRCDLGGYAHNTAGEIRDFDFSTYPFLTKRELAKWNGKFIPATMALNFDALIDSGIVVTKENEKLIGCLVGTALGGLEAYGEACHSYSLTGPSKISPMLLPNVCANVAAGMAAKVLQIRGPVFAPASACATGNHCIAEGARLIQHGSAEVMLVGGIEFPLLPPIIAGFGNMNASFKMRSEDRAAQGPELSSRPFSLDRRGFVLSEGGGILVLASSTFVERYRLDRRAEVVGTAMTSDAHHYTIPYAPSIIECIGRSLGDAEIPASEITAINAHGTSTKLGDKIEMECLREVFGEALANIPITANKSFLGHSLGASSAIEAILSIEGMRNNKILPTINYIPDPDFADLDIVTTTRETKHRYVLSNAFGFGGTNCCIIFKGTP